MQAIYSCTNYLTLGKYLSMYCMKKKEIVTEFIENL